MIEIYKDIFPKEVQSKFDIYDFRHGSTILENDFPKEYLELANFLSSFVLTSDDILTPGGKKSPIAKKFDDGLYKLGWEEKQWDIKIEVDGEDRNSPTHKVDYFKNGIAVELEWNNKDPFFDRDLNNFRLLHQLKIISVGIIVTRASELQTIFNKLNKGQSYGASTTHINKLLPKIEGGGAAECPIIVFGINKNSYK